MGHYHFASLASRNRYRAKHAEERRAADKRYRTGKGKVSYERCKERKRKLTAFAKSVLPDMMKKYPKCFEDM